jgi:heptaprenyl diphosphate synthase
VEHYLHVVAEKTGSLIATSGHFGALFAGATPAVVEILTRYGEVIGVAFQLSDDLLDIASSSGQSGKTPGTDLREGVPTLPVLYALRSTDPAEERLRTLVGEPLVDDDLHAEALGLLRSSPAMVSAQETLALYADEARALLAQLPDIPARSALQSLADFVVARTG